MSHVVYCLSFGYFLVIINVFNVENYTLNETLAVLNETVNLTEEQWPLATTNTVLSRIEENLKYYEQNEWLFDIRAAFQIFLTKLNLKIALENPRMNLFDNNDLTAIKSKRLQAIVTRADNLNYVFRYRLLARVPRRNRTRMVAAIFAFTEVAWFKFLPPMDTEDVNEELVTIVEKKFGRDFFPTPPPEKSYLDNFLMKPDTYIALNITELCIQELTQNLEDPAMLNSTVLQDATIPTTQCNFTMESRMKICRGFVETGVKKSTAGYEILFRLALLTAARIARNCYIINEYRDRVIRNYLCLMARMESDKFDPGIFTKLKNPYGCETDLLTVHDYATLCLLNGDRKFMHKRFMDCTKYCSSQWNDIGCFGYSPSGRVTNFSDPLPYWVVVRQPESDNRFCCRRLTASCLAHHSGVIRGLVELGQVKETETTTGDGRRRFGDEPTTEFDYGYD